MTADDLWMMLATAINHGDEQAARYVLTGTDRVVLEQLVLDVVNDYLFDAWATLICQGNLDPQAVVAAGLRRYALAVAQ